MTRRRDPLALAMLLTFVALATWVGASLAVPAPDAAQLASLQLEFGPHARLRLRAGGESFVLNECRLDSAGVRGVRGIDAPGAISAARLEAREIPWAGIDELARHHSHAGRGVLWGAALGLAGGFAAAASVSRQESRLDNFDPTATERATTVLAGPVMGGLLGGIGGFALPSWQKVWPGPGARALTARPARPTP